MEECTCHYVALQHMVSRLQTTSETLSKVFTRDSLLFVHRILTLPPSIDCYGPERIDEYLGKGRLDLCVVYATEPRSLHTTPGGRANARMIRKATFQQFSLLSEDGSYYIRPDRVVGCFHMCLPDRGSVDKLV